MKAGDKVKSSGKYRDIQAKFGDTVQTVKQVGAIPSCNKQMIWLDCGGGAYMADGFTVVEEAGGKESDEVVALRKTVAAQADMLKRCAAFLGETIQCGVEGEMLDGRHVNVAASDLADDIDDLLKQRTEG